MEKEKEIATFYKKIKGSPYADQLEGENLMGLILYWDKYKKAKMMSTEEEAAKALNQRFEEKNRAFFKIVQPRKDNAAKKLNRAFKKLFKARNRLLREIKKEKIDNSFLGRLGRSIVPFTQWGGFNWRVNVALLSAFAAKESSVATLGALYQQEEDGETLETRMEKGEASFTSLHALALMLFMVLYPPCIAATIMVKIQSGSYRWMLFSMAYPIVLGLMVATLVFTGGTALGLSGLQAMFVFYGLALTVTLAMGLIKNKSEAK
jgi:ferrous iron transport protein B